MSTNRAFLCSILIVILVISNAFAFFNFGKNKVRYKTLNWKTLTTNNTKIYYYSDEEELAIKTAIYAEEIVKHLEIELQHNLTRKIPIILYSNHHTFQETQVIPMIIPESVGGLTEFFKGRVLIPFDGSLPRFKRVLNHEIVHFFTLNKVNYIMRSHDKYDNFMPPLWYMEGLSEFYSKTWTPEDDMVLYDAFIYGLYRPLEDIYDTYDSYLVYKEGHSLLLFIEEEYGRDKIPQLLNEMWNTDNWEELMESVLGEDYHIISLKWTNWLRERYYPMVGKYDPPELKTSNLISGDAIYVSPAIHRTDETSTLFYVSNYLGYESIYTSRLIEKDGKLSLKEKEKIVKGGLKTGMESLHILRSRISVSDDGLLAFVSKSGPIDRINIYDIKRGEITNNISFSDIVYISSPFISCDSSLIAFSGADISGKSDIYLYDVNDNLLKRLTNDWFDDRHPIISRDNKTIVFSSDRDLKGYEGYNLFSISPDKDSEIKQLTFGKCTDTHPSFSNDNTILFSSDRSGKYNIYELKANGQLYKMTNTATGLFEPVEYDSETIIATCYLNGTMRIVSIKKSPPVISENVYENDIEKEPETMPETSIEEYNADFALDFLQAEAVYSPGFKSGVGSSIYFTDMLSDQHLVVSLSNTARSWSELLKRMNAGVAYYNLSRRVNYGLGAFHYYYDYYDAFGYYKYTEHLYGGSGTVIIPVNRFYRFEVGTMIYRLHRRDDIEKLNTNITSNYVSFVKDTSLWVSTGPIEGARYNITIGNNMDINKWKKRYMVYSFDFRKYFRLSRMSAYAVRAIFLANNGDDAETIYFGGSMGMRGYKFYEFSGKKLFLVNQEVRFPIIDEIHLRLPFGDTSLGTIRGALFIDVGSAWDDKISKLKGSFGLGLRWSLGGFVVFRLDIAKKTDFHSISEDTPIRFFIGYDY